MTVQSRELRDGAWRWWRRTMDDGKPSVDVRGRALLRRARSPQEAMTVPVAIDLARQLGAATTEGHALSTALDLARILAHVRTHTNEHPMRTLGWESFPGERTEGLKQPMLSELRFRRLLQTKTGEQRVAAFKRLIAQLGDDANVADVAEAFWFWNDASSHVKQRWAFSYFGAGIATPTSISADDNSTTDPTATHTVDKDDTR